MVSILFDILIIIEWILSRICICGRISITNNFLRFGLKLLIGSLRDNNLLIGALLRFKNTIYGIGIQNE